MQEKTTTTVTAEQFDSGLIFARTLALMNSRDIQVEHILSYELAPVPTSMFDEITRKLRIAKSTILKNKLQAEQSARATGQPDAIGIDGCAILWVVHWPSTRSCHKCCDTMRHLILGSPLLPPDDRCEERITKGICKDRFTYNRPYTQTLYQQMERLLPECIYSSLMTQL